MDSSELANPRFLSRRCFIASAVASTALARLARGGPAASDHAAARKFKICLNPGMIGIRANLKETIAVAARFGFEAVEPLAGELQKFSADEMQRIREELKSKGLVWGATGMGMPSGGSDDQFNGWLAKLTDAAAALQRAGATRMGTWITPGDNQLNYEQQFERLAKRVKAIAKVTEDHNIRFGLEYLGPKTMRARLRFEFIHTMKQMRELIAHVGASNVGLIVDSWHWYNAQEAPADIRTLKNEEIVWVHLNDAPAGVPLDKQVDNHRALPASTGVIDIGGFLGALIDIGYDGPVSAEPFDTNLRHLPREQVAQKAIDAIHKALERA